MTAEKNAVIGGVTTALWSIATNPTIVELALAFAFLVLVPLTIKLAVPSSPHSWTQAMLNKFSLVSFPFAMLGLVALSIETGPLAGFLAGGWFIYTAAISLLAFLQMIARGVRPAEEAIIDVGAMYLVVGGGWFVLSRVGAASFLPYSDVIVELTAIHFHYAAFVLPILTGVFGRWLYQWKFDNVRGTQTIQPFPFLALGIGLGPVLVALGLDLGPPYEFYLVSIYVLFVYWLCGWWLVSLKRMTKKAAIPLGLSALILLVTMTLSLLYSFGLLLQTTIISIPGMISWHGAFNAFGFAFLAVIAWLMISPKPRHDYSQFPISQLRGRGYVGSDIFSRLKWIDDRKKSVGLVESWKLYKSAIFNPDQLHPLIKEFYQDPSRFRMQATIEWHKGFNILSRLSYFLTKKIGQIQLPTSQSVEMIGEIVPIADKLDRRENVRAWIRKNKRTDEPIFSVIYSAHVAKGRTYMNIALPLFRGVMTGVLRPDLDQQDGLILTSKPFTDQKGDEGIYITLGKITVKTPLAETFHIVPTDKGKLTAIHTMACFGLTFLTIEYQLMN